MLLSSALLILSLCPIISYWQIRSFPVLDISTYNMEHTQVHSLVHEAILRGDIQTLLEGLKSTCDLEERSRSMTALQSAAHLGHFEMLPFLLTAGADINAAPSEFGCALQAVISSVKFEGQPDLLMRGQQDYIDRKRNAQEEAVHILVQGKAGVHTFGGEFGSPLAAAAAFGLKHILALLLEKGASLNSPGGRLGCPLQAASARGDMPVEWCISFATADDYDQVQDLLLNAGSPVNNVGGVYGSALEAASFMGNQRSVSRLLFYGADPNIKAGRHVSALDAATRQGHARIAQCLIEAGAKTQKHVTASTHPEDNWQSWREEPVSSLFLRYRAPLPCAKV